MLQIASRPVSEEVVSRVRQNTWQGLVSWGSRQMSTLTSVPPKVGRRRLEIVAATLGVLALAGLAVTAGVLLGRHSFALLPAIVNKPAPALATPSPAAAPIPLDPRQAIILELAATRESGERHTLVRFRAAPDGDLVVDDPTAASARDATVGATAHR